MKESHGLLIMLGFGVVTLGVVVIAYFAFLSSQRKQDVPQSTTYVQVPPSLIPSFRKD